MRYEAEVRAYDVIDQVFVTARVWETSTAVPGRTSVRLTVATTVQGEGEADPGRWLREALVAMAELL
jgi:hypothetical protein